MELALEKGVRKGTNTQFSEYVFSGIYSFLMLNIKSEISPMPLGTNAYKLKSKNNNYAHQSGPDT